MQTCRVRRTLAEMRMKAKEPQDAQIVLFDPPPRLANEAHAARRNIIKAADIVVHHSVSRHRERIDGEIAPFGVRAPIAPEHHARLPPERLGVLAQGRNFNRVVVDNGGDGAMLDTSRDRLAAGRLDPLHDLRG